MVKKNEKVKHFLTIIVAWSNDDIVDQESILSSQFVKMAAFIWGKRGPLLPPSSKIKIELL